MEWSCGSVQIPACSPHVGMFSSCDAVLIWILQFRNAIQRHVDWGTGVSSLPILVMAVSMYPAVDSLPIQGDLA